MGRRNTDEFGRDGSGAACKFGLHDRFDIVDTDQDIFRFQIGMDDTAFTVEVIETEQNLFGDLFDDMLRNASVLIPLD